MRNFAISGIIAGSLMLPPGASAQEMASVAVPPPLDVNGRIRRAFAVTPASLPVSAIPGTDIAPDADCPAIDGESVRKTVLQQEPHTARARPTTAIKDEADYKKILSEDKSKHPLNMYGAVTRILAAVEAHFNSIRSPDNQIHRNNLKLHVLMVLGWAMNGNSILPALRIAQLDLSKLTPELAKTVSSWVFEEFDKAGGEDRIAKESTFTQTLKASWTVEKTKPKAATISA